jgi:hypothetical protein
MHITGSSYSEVVVSVGRVKGPYIRAKSAVVIGVVVIPLIVADEEVVVTGSGRVGVLASETCILATSKNPLIVEKAHCANIVALGARAPVVIRDLRAVHVYARKALIGKLVAREVVLGELCNVKSLLKASRVVFSDPHVYIEEIGELEEAVFNYELPSCD